MLTTITSINPILIFFPFTLSTMLYIFYLFFKINKNPVIITEKIEPIAAAAIEKKYEDKYLLELKNMKEKNIFTEEQLLEEYNLIKCFPEMESQSLTEEEIIEKAKINISKTILDKLENSFIIEKTPIGNVIMFYDNKIETFVYYSDNTIPYRYLEVVARRYVISNQCKYLYVDLEQELKDFEEKQKKLILDKSVEDSITQPSQNINKKKDVFAKFKSYNTEAGSGRVNKAPPPKNSVPNMNMNKNNDKQILKEKANRYLCKGKISNFDILKKVDRKKIDQKYALTFADFKKMNQKLAK